MRKRFPHNPYTVTNVMDVWECDLLDVYDHAKYKDNHRYIPSVIDLLSKFLHMIPIKKKGRPSVASTFRSIFDDPKYSTGRRPIWVRNHNGKEFLNKHFQDMLRNEGDIQFQVCRNCDLKFAIGSTYISDIKKVDIYR